jgi:hypothetical protein
MRHGPLGTHHGARSSLTNPYRHGYSGGPAHGDLDEAGAGKIGNHINGAGVGTDGFTATAASLLVNEYTGQTVNGQYYAFAYDANGNLRAFRFWMNREVNR